MSTAVPERIRRAVPEDAPALSALAARLFHETYNGQNRAEDMQAYIAANFSPAKQAEELADPNFRVLLMTVEEELAGYACLRTGPAPAEVPAGIPMEVARFYVDSRWQGRGLAPRLMQACVSEAEEARCDVLWLGVWKENARAIRFYEKQGFRIAGTLLFRLGGDLQEDHLMVRPVASLLDRTTGDLLDLFAAGRNTPGAGSAAALTGALAGSLLQAVARYTIRAAAKGEDYAPFRERAEALLAEVADRARQLSRAADEDAAAFELYWRERSDEALRTATEVPLGIAEHCAALAEIGIELREHGFKAARGEAATAVLLASASGEAATRIARLNLKFAETASWAAACEERLAALDIRLG